MVKCKRCNKNSERIIKELCINCYIKEWRKTPKGLNYIKNYIDKNHNERQRRYIRRLRELHSPKGNLISDSTSNPFTGWSIFKMTNKKCLVCKKEFVPKKKTSILCSKQCHNKYLSKIGKEKGFGKWMKGRIMGELNHQWLGGKSFKPYTKDFNIRFKKAIKERDGCCMLCNIGFDDLKLLKRYVQVHHIDYNKLNSFPQNCITLCVSCHSKTNYNRNQWKLFFQSLLKERYNYKYSEDQKIIFDFNNSKGGCKNEQ